MVYTFRGLLIYIIDNQLYKKSLGLHKELMYIRNLMTKRRRIKTLICNAPW